MVSAPPHFRTLPYNCIPQKVKAFGSTLQSRIVFEIPGVVLFFINKNSVLISVFGISEKARGNLKSSLWNINCFNRHSHIKFQGIFLNLNAIQFCYVVLYLKVLL
jgi:hypothetical protein